MIPLTESERGTLRAWSRWGTDSLNLRRSKGRWWIDNPGGPPIPFTRRRDAVEHWLQYIDSLLERNGYFAQRSAVHALLDRTGGDEAETVLLMLRSVSGAQYDETWARGVLWEHLPSWSAVRAAR